MRSISKDYWISLAGLVMIALLCSACQWIRPPKAVAGDPGKSVQEIVASDQEQELLDVGSPAPDFELPATSGTMVSLKAYRGKNIILVFYPKDQTPGCTIQLCTLRDDYGRVQATGTEVLASNPDSMESHLAFAKKHNLPFPILVDAQKTMARDYRTLGPMGWISRTVYIIDKNGVIRYARRGMPSTQELLGIIEKLDTP